MPKFRKKPVVIEAVQWQGNTSVLQQLSVDLTGCDEVHRVDHGDRICRIGDNLRIRTLEGDMLAEIGDWIIRGVKGELYPCKPDIFAETYEAVE